MTDQAAVAATPLSVYSAGSLREALTTIAADYEVRSGQKTALTFGASGLLRQRIEQGEGAQVFASADTDHPQRLANRGGWLTPQVFAGGRRLWPHAAQRSAAQRCDAPPAARAFVAYVLSEPGQAVLQLYGFARP